MTADTLTRAATTRRPRWLALAGWQFLGQVTVFAVALVAAVVLAAVVLAILSRVTTPSYSALQVAVQAAPWLPFAIAIHFSTSWLNLQLAAGLTRRSSVKAAVLSGFGTGAATAVLLAVTLWAEHLVYGRLGWTAAHFSDRTLLPEGPWLPQLWGLFLIMSAWALTGTVVGLAYQRFGAGATLLLPVMLLPLAAVALLVIDPMTMWAPVTIVTETGLYTPARFGFGGLAGVAAGVAVLALVVAAIHLLARRLLIRSPRS